MGINIHFILIIMGILLFRLDEDYEEDSIEQDQGLRPEML